MTMCVDIQFAPVLSKFETSIGDRASQNLNDLQIQSWALSRMSLINPSLVRPYEQKIREVNSVISTQKPALAKKLECEEYLVEQLKIVLPQSSTADYVQKVSLPFRILTIIVRSLLTTPIYITITLCAECTDIGPSTIVNQKTPIVLIHGSQGCQKQWGIFRRFLEAGHVGHVFSFNLNERALANDKVTIEGYANTKLKDKMHRMKASYAQHGLQLNEVIVIGYSMGGLIASAYTNLSDTAVKIKTIIAMSTPWLGAPIASLLFDKTTHPYSALRTDCWEMQNLREQMIAKVLQGEIDLYTYSSSLDPIVPLESSTLPIAPDRQVYSLLHDHTTSLIDPWAAWHIRDNWIAPHTSQLTQII